MKRLLCLLFCLFNAPASVSVHAQQTPLDSGVETRIASIEEKVIAWRRDFHEHPELSNREFRTAERIAEHLRSLGIEVTTGVAHTGVVGVLNGGRSGPVVALRADMDALPITEIAGLSFASTVKDVYSGEQVGVMHACGHDTHVAMMMGVAEILAGMKDELRGTVKFIFQPAEEGAPVGEEGGAELMVKEGVLDNPHVDVAFALHIDAFLEAGKISYNAGGTYASVDDFRIVVTGKGAHGASPWVGIDPIVTSAQMISAFQTIVSRQLPLTESAAVVTVGSIHGGNRSNIIPEQVEMKGTLRALNADVRTKIHEKVRLIATNVAESMGASVEIQLPYSTSYPVTYNDPVLTAEMAPVLDAVAGPGNSVARVPETAAEDFSFFAEKVPGLYFILGGRPSGISIAETADHHTPGFYVDESGLILGVRAMTALTLSYLKTHAEN